MSTVKRVIPINLYIDLTRPSPFLSHLRSILIFPIRDILSNAYYLYMIDYYLIIHGIRK